VRSHVLDGYSSHYSSALRERSRDRSHYNVESFLCQETDLGGVSHWFSICWKHLSYEAVISSFNEPFGRLREIHNFS
jgi:hypothetical protein